MRRLGLQIVDGLELDAERRAALRPGELAGGHRLPRWFFRVESARRARETQLAEHFTLNEFINVDVREAPALLEWPRYVPLAVTALAAHLELFRARAGGSVHLTANGAYRSPAHARGGASVHCWGAAADIFQIGAERIEDRERIERSGAIAEAVLPGAHVKRAFDHLHIDLGYVIFET